MGAGRAIVSTPYAYAQELLADGRGVLVPPASPAALGAALNEILGDDDLRASLGRRAHATVADGLVRGRRRLRRSLRTGRRAGAIDGPVVTRGRQCLTGRHCIPSAGGTSTCSRIGSGYSSIRSGRDPTRPTAIASTTSPAPSRWTCSTGERSAGRPSRTAPGEASRSSRRHSTRPVAGSGTSGRSTGHGSAASAPTTVRDVRSSHWARSSRPRRIGRWPTPRRRSSARRARGPSPRLPASGGVGRARLCRDARCGTG